MVAIHHRDKSKMTWSQYNEGYAANKARGLKDKEMEKEIRKFHDDKITQREGGKEYENFYGKK